MTRTLEDLVGRAFTEEDESMIAAVQARVDGRELWSMKPDWLEGDKAAVWARRTILRRREAEVGAGVEPPLVKARARQTAIAFPWWLRGMGFGSMGEAGNGGWHERL